MNLSTHVKIRKVKAASADATGAVNSDVVDMQGFDGCVFMAVIGTANAGNYMNIAQGTDAEVSDAADLLGTKVVAANDGDIVAVDVYKPAERYLRAEFVRTASTTIGDVYALCYEGHKLPVDNNVDDEIVSELHITPAEGTA